MAWRCSGTTNAELISNLVSCSLITSPLVSAALMRVDRANYVPISSRAYQDSPQTIGYGATISAPHMHAHAAEALLPFLTDPAGSRVLDVGSGSGYTLAMFYHLVAPQGGTVVGVEHISELVQLADSNLRKDGLHEALLQGSISNTCGDGRSGCKEQGPFDAIHVGAAAKGIPVELVNQLKCPGRLFVPVEEEHGGEQYIWQVDKAKDGTVTKEKICAVRYVPLTDSELQWQR